MISSVRKKTRVLKPVLLKNEKLKIRMSKIVVRKRDESRYLEEQVSCFPILGWEKVSL